MKAIHFAVLSILGKVAGHDLECGTEFESDEPRHSTADSEFPGLVISSAKHRGAADSHRNSSE